jgi:general secretion pathway protein H
MRISAPGSSVSLGLSHCAGRRPPLGFTLLELLVVIAIMALATAGVSLALRDSSETQLEREAQRLAALLESGRSQARMASVVVRWHPTATGFVFDGLPGAALPDQWLGNDVQAAAGANLILGPEPVLSAQKVRLFSISNPQRSLTLGTDGIRPFAVLADPAPAANPP